MRVLAVGAAGAAAGLVVQALAARDVEVRGLVHSPGRGEAARRNGATEVAVADLNDRGGLRTALEGVDSVFHLIPAFVEDEAATGVTLIEVAAEAGVRRVVFSSVYHPSLTDLSNHRDKQPAERALYDSAMEFTVLQPAMFMAQLDALPEQAQRTGTISGPYSPASAMSYVDFHDVAEVAALAFVTDRFVNGTFELAADGMYSRHDLAALLSGILGRSVRADGAVPPQAALENMDPAMRDGLHRMFAHYDRVGFHGGNSMVLEAMLGRPPMGVEDYLRNAVEASTAGPR